MLPHSFLNRSQSSSYAGPFPLRTVANSAQGHPANTWYLATIPFIPFTPHTCKKGTLSPIHNLHAALPQPTPHPFNPWTVPHPPKHRPPRAVLNWSRTHPPGTSTPPPQEAKGEPLRKSMPKDAPHLPALRCCGQQNLTRPDQQRENRRPPMCSGHRASPLWQAQHPEHTKKHPPSLR